MFIHPVGPGLILLNSHIALSLGANEFTLLVPDDSILSNRGSNKKMLKLGVDGK